MTTEIHLNVIISSDAYDDNTMERLRTETRKGFTQFVFSCAKGIEIDHTKLNIQGGIKTEVK